MIDSPVFEVIDEIIVTLATAIRNIFPGVRLAHIIPKVREVGCIECANKNSSQRGQFPARQIENTREH